MKLFFKPLALLAILLGLLAVALWEDKKSKSDQEIASSEKKLLNLKVSELVKVEYRGSTSGSENPSNIVLEKSDGKWRIANPIIADADSAAVDRWIQTLADAQYEKKFTSREGGLSEFGLEKPPIEVSFYTSSSEKTSIGFGSKSPVGYSSYARIEGAPDVFLVGHYLVTSSTKSVNEFRSKSIGMPRFEDLQDIKISERNVPETVLSRGSEGAWSIAGKTTIELDPEAVNSFILSLSGVVVETFVDNAEAVLAKTNSRDLMYSIQVSNKTSSDKKSWKFFESGGIAYMLNETTKELATVDRKYIEKAFWSSEQFTNKKLTSFTLDQLEKVTINGEEYVRSESNWVHGKDKNKTAQGMDRFLNSLGVEKASKVLTEDEIAKLSLNPAKYIVRLEKKDSADELNVYSIQGEKEIKVLIKTKGRVLEVSNTLLANLEKINEVNQGPPLGMRP